MASDILPPSALTADTLLGSSRDAAEPEAEAGTIDDAERGVLSNQGVFSDEEFTDEEDNDSAER